MTTKTNRSIELLMVFVLAVSFVPAAFAQQMSAPLRQVLYEDAYKPGLSWPKWEQGYLVSWKIDTPSSDSSENLTLYDRDGKIVGKTRIWLQGSSLVRILDATPRKDGNVAVVGWAVADSGEMAGFLADVSVAQGSSRVIRTSPFEGQAVTFGPDGTMWVVGLQVGPERHVKAAADHFVIQHYGKDGKIESGHLLRSEFPCPLHPSLSGNRELPRIMASSDRIGFFAPACRMWTELNLNGQLLGHWKWNKASSTQQGAEQVAIRSLELTASNELYGLMESRKGQTFVRFDRASSSWIPMDVSAADAVGAPVGRLWGTDGDAVVYVTLGINRAAWFRPTAK